MIHRYLYVSVLSALAFVAGWTVSVGTTLAQNTPHVAYGSVHNSDGGIPADSCFLLNAYVATRPMEVLTKNSVGCGYHEPDGIWWINVGNFTTGWKVGEVLRVDLVACNEQAGIETGYAEGVLTGAGSDDFGLSTLAREQSSNPVELSSFQAQCVDGCVHLEWTTATETNNYGFEVERSVSPTFEAFDTIHFVKGKGTTLKPSHYSFVDTQVAAATYYYRLKQIDLDGSFHQSVIVEVNVAVPSTSFLVHNYPNPFNPETTIKFYLPSSDNVLVRVLDVLGKEVRVLVNEKRQKGYHETQWDARDFKGEMVPSGVYFCCLTVRDSDYVMKMMLTK